MFIAKLRGAALGLAALAVVATGVTVTSGQDGSNQGAGPGAVAGEYGGQSQFGKGQIAVEGAAGQFPEGARAQFPVEERLDSLESKIDQLLEALGGAGQNGIRPAGSNPYDTGVMPQMMGGAIQEKSLTGRPVQRKSKAEEREQSLEERVSELERQLAEVINRLDRIQPEGRQRDPVGHGGLRQ